MNASAFIFFAEYLSSQKMILFLRCFCKNKLNLLANYTFVSLKIAHFELICANIACGLRKITYFRKVFICKQIKHGKDYELN